MSRYLFMPVLWFWLALALMILVIRQVPPFSAITADKLIVVVEQAKLFFLSILLPLVLTKDACPVRNSPNGTVISNGVGHLAAFILLSLPLTILASYFSCAGFSVLLRSHLVLILIATALVLMCMKFPGRLTVYYLVFIILFGVLPILHYLVLEFAGKSLWVLTAINPFYLFWQIKTPNIFYAPWFYNCLLWLMVITVLFFIRPIGTKNNNEKIC
ncbi:MAG: hypothetical protein HZA49_08945 [Planctomycetes bacterium]|nr:hypothetical protein [Planctomycetota bacterium]